MSFTEKIADFFGGGVVSTIADTVKSYFPPSMSDKEKAELERHIRDAEMDNERKMMAMAIEADKEVTNRAAQLEGTAKDLAALPVVGRIVIFLRGCLRPAYGYGTLWTDIKIFSGGWKLTLTTPGTGEFTAEGWLLLAVNVLVLGFLFGERTVKNLMPIFTQFMAARGFAVGKAKGGAA